MKNYELAKIFYDIADILELKRVRWKPQAYRKVARAIENLKEDVKVLYEKDKLKDIPGVGEGIKKKIVEYLETGEIKEYLLLKKKIPNGLENLMGVLGLGAKRILVLHQKLKIKSLKDLEKAVKKHKIAKLEGFGEKSEQNIKEAIQLFKRRKKRMLLGEALITAENIINNLKPYKVVYAGSLRRMEETIGDIDLLAVSSDKKLIGKFTKLENVKKVLAKGGTKSTILLDNDVQVDLRLIKRESYGAALQYFTGSKEHSIKTRQLAIKKKYKLNEYGLFKGKRKIAGVNEREIYKKLGLGYIQPEMRNNTGELNLKKLPNLVKLKDIKGDLHVHTNVTSDATGSIKNMILAAKSKGYEYIAITEHSKSLFVAGGLNEDEILEHVKKIKKTSKNIKGIKVLAGAEVDILKKGNLDYSDDVLKKLDVVLMSLHTGQRASKEEITRRVLKAMKNENTHILAHPTTRVINYRPASKLDMDKVLQMAKETGKILEVNSSPLRLDLNDYYIRKCVENKVKLCINTDAHSVGQLDLMKLGVGQARRGWAEKKDIVNTYTYKKLLKN